MSDATIYFSSAFITGASALVLCIFVFLKAQHRLIATHFAWYTLFIGIWALFVGFATSTDSETLCYFFSLVCHTAGLFIPLTFLHFVVVYTGNHTRWIRKLLWGGYAVMILIAVQIMFYPQLFIPSVTRKLGFNFFPDPGPTYHFWVIFFTLTVLLADGVLLMEGLKLRGAQRHKILAFLVANLCGYLGGMGAFFPVYDLSYFPFPYGIWGVFFFTVITAYAVLRLKLINLESEIRKTVVFAGLFIFVFGIFAGISTLLQEVFNVHLRMGRTLSALITVAIIVFFYERIRDFLTEMTDRFLFQKKLDYQKILKDASRGLSQIENLRHLLGLVVHFMTMRARIVSAAVYLRHRSTEDFSLHYERGYGSHRASPVIAGESALVQFFTESKEAIDQDRLELALQGEVSRIHWSQLFLQSVLKEMKELGATACVPTFLGGVLKYFLVLGRKKSGDCYTDEDLNLLFTLAQESAIAIENAKLYDEAVHKNLELQEINRQLNEASLQLQHALSVTEKANKQLLDTQALLIHEQKMATMGRLASSVGHEVNNPLTILQMNINRMVLKYRKDPELKVSEIAEFFSKMEANINRIKAVVNTLTGLLKKHEKGKMEPLSLKLVLEETLPLVQFQTYLDNLPGTEIIFNIPGSLPLIKGDLERLQEVFLNIFINAFHALADKKDRRIEISCDIDPEEERIVLIQFKDNGCGMDEETLKKIFAYRFTTKPEGKGSGLGLYIAKYIIELHGGRISVESTRGQGTAFFVRLPICEEKETGTEVRTPLHDSA
jgi:signal transduction histidine kinase